MNHKYLTAAVIATVSLFPTNALAQSDKSSASASASSAILQPLTIAKNADLAFGRIVKPSTGTGEVSIATGSDGVTATGAVALAGVTTSRAKFAISGDGGQAVSISVPETMNMVNGNNSITVSLDADLDASTTLDSNGAASLNVGGQFSLPSTAAAGQYTGTFQVEVAYQ